MTLGQDQFGVGQAAAQADMTGRSLSLLLAIKGKPLHALRLLWHSNRVRIPFRFLIADGEGHPAVVALLKRSTAIFPHLDIQHVVYDDNGSFNHFYRRTADAVARISTRYAMNCGDDDFVLEAGTRSCIGFLEAQPDYVCCGGGIAGFSLAEPPSTPGLPAVGTLDRLDYRRGRYYASRDINQDTALERIRHGFGEYLSSYYNVFRAEALVAIYREIEELDFAVLHLREAYQAMRTLAFGKVKSDPTFIHYIRQNRIGKSAAGDLIRLAFHPPFNTEFEKMVKRLTVSIGAAEGISSEVAETEIRDAYAEFFRRKAAGSVKRAKSAARPIALESEDPELLDRLSEDGASPGYLVAFLREFTEIKKTLAGEEFAEFVRAYAPGLLPNGGD